MDLTVASTTGNAAAVRPDRVAPASVGAASTSGPQPAIDVVDLRSVSEGSDSIGSGVIVRMKVGGVVRTYTYNSFQ